MIWEKYSRDLVSGFLRADGKKIVNGNGEEILLCGVGVGGWLLYEGYMWGIHTIQYSSPRGLSLLVRELCGSKYAKEFWKKFRANFLTHEDIKEIAKMGYNSIRVPLHWNMFLENEPEIIWKDEGFELMDKLLDWCEQEKIYVIPDLHASHGGHTGSNIDDSLDDYARMFKDKMSWDRTILLWTEFARRYADRWIIGGYDFLNEPIRSDEPPKWMPQGDLVPKLRQFYRELSASVRAVDKNHMFIYEGHNWASRTDIFDEIYDENMVIEPHRYWIDPVPENYTPFLKVSENLNKPIWLGESGENHKEWYAAMFPIAAKLGIGFCFWPYKRMAREDGCPAIIRQPENWQKVIDFTVGGARPEYDEAQKMFDELLENAKLENCKKSESVNAHIFRTVGATIKGQDYDKVESSAKNMHIYKLHPDAPNGKYHRNKFEWEDQTVDMSAEGFAYYTFFHFPQGAKLKVSLTAKEDSKVAFDYEGAPLGEFALNKSDEPQEITLTLPATQNEGAVKMSCADGCVTIHTLSLLNP